ncbi:hypothetical protein JIG36_08055 [Actinoplanes sp. LDG1-06]|uniref:Uncharacterized protein n=1 Tax=Paractinoplanes ovalisporus TaxID=2810368 RepID=A0ABS2A6Q4_9ACTN|nr:hypothetical protein [Actinoplanes ovalisporus]MBM2615517.1 hypothetical protein [Actinoplanes ovalisporus]
MFRTVDAEARSVTTANEIAALLRAEYVASGNRAYLHAANIALSRSRENGVLLPEATPEPV